MLARGGVLTFELPPGADVMAAAAVARAKLAPGLGEFRQDGLGWVLVNPDFVLQPSVLRAETRGDGPGPAKDSEPTSPLTRFARRETTAVAVARRAMELGSQWAREWQPNHREASHVSRLRRAGSSQWNQIRQMATRARGDLARLSQDLAAHCRNGTRKSYWLAEVRRQRLGDILIGKCTANPAEDGGLPSGPLRCAAVAHAAAVMVRWLQSQESRE